MAAKLLLKLTFLALTCHFCAAEVCTSLDIGYKTDPQTSKAPYQVLTDSKTYRPNQVINVTIRALNQNQRFNGFVLQARRIGDETEKQKELIGKFSPISGTKTICTSQSSGNALSHDDNGMRLSKSELFVFWTAPEHASGHVQFIATIVESPDVYWARVLSDVLVDPEAPSLDYTPIDVSSCGRSKSCYRNPPNCEGLQCDAVVTWRNDGNYVDFELSAQTDGWVAVGLSQDCRMGNDDVTECVWNSDRGVIEVSKSFNVISGKSNFVVDPLTDTLWKVLNTSRSTGMHGHLQCRFRRPKVATGGRSTIFELERDNQYHIFLAKGDATPNGVKMRHSLEPEKYPYISPSMVSLAFNNRDLSGRFRFWLVKFHGCLMVFAWMFCAMLAVLMAKYYKLMWPNRKICGEKVWFSVHRSCQVTALANTIIAFILIFIHCRGYSQMPDLSDSAHPPLGIVTGILMVINIILAVVRPHPKNSYRAIFNWLHWFIGTCTMVFATVTMMIGLNLPKAHVPWWASWVVVVFMLFHLIIELLLEIHGCINGHKQKARDEDYAMRHKPIVAGNYKEKLPEPVGYHFKRRVLAVYVPVAIICTLILMIAILVG